MLKLIKRIRQRFGISAPRMTVRTHVAWYWRWLLFFSLLSMSLTLAAWMYDAGRRFAGFDRGEIEQAFHQRLHRLRRSTAAAARRCKWQRAVNTSKHNRQNFLPAVFVVGCGSVGLSFCFFG